MTTFRFANPLAFLLLILPIVLFLAIRLRIWKQSPSVMRYSDTRLMNTLPSSWRVKVRWLPDLLRLLAWVLLVIALARPQSGRTQEVIRGQGIDIVLALDISGSMATRDFVLEGSPQSRLDAAKSVIADFVSGREFDRMGLVVFAQDAFHQVPPTLDYGVLLRLLDEVKLATEIAAINDGTAIGLGLASAANMVRESDANSRIIILLTDGSNNAGPQGPLTAAEALAALGMRVYTIGVGSQGMISVPVDDQGNTQLVESDLDEETLQAIASMTDGQYFLAEDLASLQAVYDQIDVLERSEVERQVFVRWREQATPLMVAGFVLLVLERLLRVSAFQSLP